MVDTIKKEIKIECKRMEEDSLHTSRNHFISGNFWRSIYLFFGITNTLVAALAGSIALYFEEEITLVAFLAIIVAIISGIITFLNPSEKASKYKSKGDEFLALRSEFRIFRNIDILNLEDINEIKAKFDFLVNKKNQLTKSSLPISKRHYEKAKKGIENGEAEYEADTGNRD